MKNSLITILFFSFAVFSFAGQTDMETKMLHLIIRADQDKVYVENLWVINRPDQQNDFAKIPLPQNAELFQVGGTNTIALEDNKLRVNFKEDSIIASTGFVFTVENREGTADFTLELPFKTNSVAVYLSGTGSKLTSPDLEKNQFQSDKSEYSHVFTGQNFESGQSIEFKLSRMPAKQQQIIGQMAIVGLLLLLITALFTIYIKRNRIR